MTEKTFTKRQMLFVETTFAGNDEYGWMRENHDDPRGETTDEQLREWLEFMAHTSYDQAVVDYEDEFDADLDMTFQEFLQESDFETAYEHLQEQRDERHDEYVLRLVMTPKEIAEEFDVKEDTVRDAIEHEWLLARKSGGTWLVLEEHAAKRWKKRE